MPAPQDGRDDVVVVDYDPAWPGRFEEERTRIDEALAEVDGVLAIEHVGSTAVSGLAAKPILDIMVGVRDLPAGQRCVGPMVALGYESLGEHGIPGRFYFRKGSPRTHHVHMVERASGFWERHLAFRDALRSDPALAREYGDLKKGLAAKFRTQRLAYTEAKSPFVEAALLRAAREARS